jgi:hypothetical protein
MKARAPPSALAVSESISAGTTGSVHGVSETGAPLADRVSLYS